MKLTNFLETVSMAIDSDNVTLDINVRIGQYGYLDNNEASKLKSYLIDHEIPFKDEKLAGDTWTLKYVADGFNVTVWYSRIKTLEERHAELTAELEKIENELEGLE
jgi:hypothetical protein